MNCTLCKYQYGIDALALNGNISVVLYWIQDNLCWRQLEAIWTVNLWQILSWYWTNKLWSEFGDLRKSFQQVDYCAYSSYQDQSGALQQTRFWCWIIFHRSRMEQFYVLYWRSSLVFFPYCWDVCVARCEGDGNLRLPVTNANHLPKHSQPRRDPAPGSYSSRVRACMSATVNWPAATMPRCIGRHVWCYIKSSWFIAGHGFRSGHKF